MQAMTAFRTWDRCPHRNARCVGALVWLLNAH